MVKPLRTKAFLKKDRARFALSYASDVDFENDITPQQGDWYFNTADKMDREYIDGAWRYKAGGGTATTVFQPSTAILSPWKRATNPVFVSSSVVRVDRTTESDLMAVVGSPIRYSQTAAANTWKLGQITGVTTNLTTLDITIVGVPMTAPLVTFVEFGNQTQFKEMEIILSGSVSVGDDLEGTAGRFTQWARGKAYIVRILIYAGTVDSSMTFQWARNGVGNNVTTSGIVVSSANTVVSTGVTIDENNQVINLDERQYLNLDAGSGSNIKVVALVVMETANFQEFIPIGPGDSPYAFLGGGLLGNTNTSQFAEVEYFSFSGVGSSQFGRNLSQARGCNASVYGPINTYNVGGYATGSTGVSTIDRFLTQAISGTAVSCGSAAIARGKFGYWSGQFYGYFGVGRTSSTPGTEIQVFDITLDTVSVSSTGNSIEAKVDTGSGFVGGRGYMVGGNSVSTTQMQPGTTNQKNTIEQFTSTSLTVGLGVSKGTLASANGAPFCASWVSGQLVFIAGGIISSTFQTAISHFNADGLAATVTSRDALSVARAGGAGASSPTKGNLIGGATTSSIATVSNLMEEFVFTSGSGLLTVAVRGSKQTACFGFGACR